MILDRYLLKQFYPIFLIVLFMLILLVSLVDLFANLWRYLSYEVPAAEIFRVSLYFLPKSFSYALPVALLFASAFTLGDLYAKNELTSIFASGIPFWRFSVPLLAVGLFASFFNFFFDDNIVIPTLRIKNELSRTLLRQVRSESNSDLVIRARNGDLIYSVDFFDNSSAILNGISIIEKDNEGKMKSIIRASRAIWKEEYWEFANAVIYEWEGDLMRIRDLQPTDNYREPPDTFRRNMVEAEDLNVKDAWGLVEDLRAAGFPVTRALSEYHHRFSFPTVCFIVMILSIPMGVKFRKNVLLMSLLTSVSVAVLFFVMDMITMMMSRLGYIPPIIGAWFPVLFFTAAGILLLRSAKT